MSERQPARSTTPRGFTIYDQFADISGHIVRVQESSLATDDSVWIFCSGGISEHAEPELTVEQATWLRDALDTFIREQAP